jgi:predicted enzyme related to lactoylglutathione lyase
MKGYKSADMFKNWEMPITNGELEKAAQWYGELFAMTTEVEPAYYYRYAPISSFHWRK